MTPAEVAMLETVQDRAPSLVPAIGAGGEHFCTCALGPCVFHHRAEIVIDGKVYIYDQQALENQLRRLMR